MLFLTRCGDTHVRTKEFDYHLPPESIAQEPAEPRDASRLLVVNRATGQLEHKRFHEIVDYLRAGDLLIANETRVIPARLRARKVPSGGKLELLLLAKRDPRRWEALVKGRRAMPGQRIEVMDADDRPIVAGEIESLTPSGGRQIRFDQAIEAHLQDAGIVPLPPYIHRPLPDGERYQTVYSQIEGSVAAPTAGLHFTPDLLDRLRTRGIDWETVILHIGLDTFRPVTEEIVEEHQIHTEYGILSARVADKINLARSEGRRVIAVGTTTVRVLETGTRDVPSGVAPWEGQTDLFIYPGYRFRAIDALITNFHLPRSSLLMLVSAFASTDLMQRAYAEAIARRYRFYSLGDSMFIQ